MEGMSEEAYTFHVGQLVNVAARTWSGINQPGGVGRITGVGIQTVNVKYVIDGRREQNVAVEYVQVYQDRSRLRNRTMLLGRCQNCGSLRIDCGSCDVWVQEEDNKGTFLRSRAPKDSLQSLAQHDIKASSSDSDSSTDLEELLEQTKKQDRMYQRFKRKAQRYLSTEFFDHSDSLGHHSANESTSEEDEDDFPLQQLIIQVNRRKRFPLASLDLQLSDKRRRRRQIRKRRLEKTTSSPKQDEVPDVDIPSVSSPGTVESSSEGDASSRSDASETAFGLDDHQSVNSDNDTDPVMETQNDDFIQPEGKSQDLPLGMHDETSSLSFSELGPFFDRKALELQTVKIPDYKKQVIDLETRWKSALRKEQRSRLLSETENLHELLVEDLVRWGLDQCRIALRKVSSSRLFRENKHLLVGNERRRRLEVRSFKFDSLNDASQALIAKVVELIRKGYADDASSVEDEANGDDGWADPLQESPVRSGNSVHSQSQGRKIDNSLSPPFDPHRYAMKKRKSSGLAREPVKIKPKRTRTGQASASGVSRRAIPVGHAHNLKRTSCTSRWVSYKTKEANATEFIPGEDVPLESSPLIESRSITGSPQCSIESSGDETGISENCTMNNEPIAVRRNDIEAKQSIRPRYRSKASGRKRVTFNPQNTSSHPVGSGNRNGLYLTSREYRRERSLFTANERSTIDKQSPLYLQKSLFAALNSTADNTLSGAESKPVLEEDECVLDMCSLLRANFPGPGCRQMMQRISLWLDANRQIASEFAPVLFETALDLLRVNGYMTIQQVVATNSTAFGSHVDLLALIIKFLQYRINEGLTPEYKSLYRIFSPERCKQFISFVLLQIVDSAYSAIHPLPWKLASNDRRKILDQLKPLCIALGSLIELTNRVCQCVVERLENQRWYISADRSNAFISCVNPRWWFDFLETGAPLPKPPANAVRFSAFKEHPPRTEVDALWGLLAYFSACSLSSAPLCGSTLTVLKTLVSHIATFPSEKSCSLLPPSFDQMETAEREIQKLSTLLASQGMGTPPSCDEFICTLIRSLIFLQADAYQCSEELRRSSYPALGKVKDSKRTMKRFWNRMLSDPDPLEFLSNWEPVEIASAMMRSRSPFQSIGLPVLMPFSSILKSCMCLLSTWMSRAALDKKARRIRLNSAINDLVKGVSTMGCCGAASAQPAAIDLFAESFISIDSGNVHKHAFLGEAAAFLMISSRIVFWAHLQEPSIYAMCEEAWGLVADTTMKERQAALLETSSCSTTYTAGALRPFLAARVVAFISSLVLGKPGWNDDPQATFKFVPVLPVNNGDNDVLLFNASCLASCLDIAADCPSSSWAMISISVLIGEFTARAKQILSNADERTEMLAHSIHRCCDSMLKIVFTPFRRCLCTLTRLQACGFEEDVAIQAILSMMNTVVNFVSCHKSSISAWPPTTCLTSFDIDDGDDLWGGLDDNVFASLDSQICDLDHQHANESTLPAIRALLIDLLEQGRPSKRFVVADLASNIDHCQPTSSQGRCCLGRNVVPLCRCLVAVAVLEGSQQIQSVVDVYVGEAPLARQIDAEYYATISRSVAHELCDYASNSDVVKKILHQSTWSFTCNLLHEMLDMSPLRKLPSLNLDRIRTRCGIAGEKKVFLEMYRIASPAKSSLRECIQGLWRSCAAYDRIFLRRSSDDKNTHSPLYHDHNPDTLPVEGNPSSLSIETECVLRMKLIRSLACRSSEDTNRMISFVIACTADQLRKLQKILEINDQACEGASLEDYERAKLFELFCCYVELHVSVTAMVFCEALTVNYDRVCELWKEISEEYMAPLLRKQALPPSTIFDVLKDVGLPFDHNVPSKNVTDLTEGYRYTSTYYFSMIRRSRELALCVAKSLSRHSSHLEPLFDALVAAGTCESPRYAWTISRALSSNCYDRTSSETEFAPDSPFEDEVDAFFANVEECHPLSREECTLLLRLKQYAIRTILIPRLVLETTEATKKAGILQLLVYMLEMEHGEYADLDSRPRIEAILLCSLARALRTSLEIALRSPVIENTLMQNVFRCASALFGLPAACVDKSAVGWLLDWITEHHLDESKYLSEFSCWLKAVGELALCGGDQLKNYRSDLRENVLNKSSCTDLHASADTLRELESQLFPELRRIQVTNIYSKRVRLEDPLECWEPEPSVRRAIHGFVCKLESTT